MGGWPLHIPPMLGRKEFALALKLGDGTMARLRMGPGKRGLLAMALALALGWLVLGCGLVGEVVDPYASNEEDPGVIVFASQRSDGNYEIYAFDGAGRGLVQLTDHPSADGNPAWSPDGAFIAFTTQRDAANPEIYAVDFNGENPINLTHFPLGEYRPAWSPTGGHLAFDSRRDGNSEIYLLDLVAGADRRLTFHRAEDQHPTWSPDGTRLAFESGRQVFTREGFDPDEIADLEARAIAANQAAQVANDSSFNEQIFVVDAVGGPVRRLTYSRGRDREPAWSPDGTQIAFASDQDGDFDIYVVDVEGGGVTNLTPWARQEDSSPCWSPDGRKIAFVSNRLGSRDIFVMNADGTQQRNLTQVMFDDLAPAWMPDIPLDSRDRCLLCPGRGFGRF